MTFDANGDVTSGNFVIYNVQYGDPITVGTSSNGTLNVTGNMLYGGGTTAIPADAPPSQAINLGLTSAPGLVLVIITCLGMMVALGLIALVAAFRQAPTFKASSPLFCILELFGCIFSFVSVLLKIMLPTASTCCMEPIFLNFGFLLVIGNVVAKNFRVYRIHHNVLLNGTVITDKQLIKISGVLFILGITFTLLHVCISLPKPYYIFIDAKNHFETCKADNPSIPLVVISTIYSGGLLLYAAYLAFRTRTAGATYKECKQIAFSVYNILLCAIISFPISILSEYLEQFIVVTTCILWATWFTMLALFSPKVYSLWKMRKGLDFNHVGSAQGQIQPIVDAYTSGEILSLEATTEAHGGTVPVQRRFRWFPFVSAWEMQHVIVFPQQEYFSCFSIDSKRGRIYLYSQASVYTTEQDQYVLKVHGLGFRDYLIQVESLDAFQRWKVLFNRQRNENFSSSCNDRPVSEACAGYSTASYLTPGLKSVSKRSAHQRPPMPNMQEDPNEVSELVNVPLQADTSSLHPLAALSSISQPDLAVAADGTLTLTFVFLLLFLVQLVAPKLVRVPSSSSIMVDWTPPPDVNNGLEAPRQAACLTCRRSKTKCDSNAGDFTCKRCYQTGTECIRPRFHIGRQKGIKNKRSGLDKAVHQIEQAIKRSKVNGGGLENGQTALDLQQFMSEAHNLLRRKPAVALSSDLIPAVEVHAPSPPLRRRVSAFRQDHLGPPSTSTVSSGQGNTDGNFALDDAESPLQLLAHAADLPLSRKPPSAPTPPWPVPELSHFKHVRNESDEDLQTSFGPFKPHLDVGEDIDPVDMGFVTLPETEVLFTFFYRNLAHTRWGLDPLVHTASFVRSRSAFLFTSILAASALFLPSTAALSKRLSIHCKGLAQRVIANRNRSVEIVLAFMVNIPWMSPGKHWADDETCSYLAMALTVAMDLSLNKIIVPSPSVPYGGIPEGVAKSDCLDARKALNLDGFDDVDPSSAWGRRLLRRRERVWLSLFVLDRGICLARGRSYTVPMTSLVETCDNWHSSDIADTWDGSIISSAVIRRDLVSLIANVRASCNSRGVSVVDGSVIAQSIKDTIESFFDRWYATWAFEIGEGQQRRLPPYVEILVSHTRLSTYSSVINHPTAPVEVKRFFRAAGLSSALNVMRAAVQGEGKLKSMPNNTAIMISFAACIALSLSTMAAGNRSSLAPSVRNLIEETADVLERIGATPSHRKGASALYGRHLRDIVRHPPELSNTQGRIGQPMNAQTETVPIVQDTFMEGRGQEHQNSQVENPAALLSSEPLLFSAMSDFQIVEAINNVGSVVETLPADFQVDNITGLDWLDWPSLA